MVALLHPEALEINPDALNPDDLNPGIEATRPHLRVLEGGLADRASQDIKTALYQGVAGRFAQRLAAHALGVLALVIVMAVLILRLAQGTPPASSWQGLEQRAEASTGISAAVGGSLAGPELASGETVRVIVAGDTLWDIAGELAPGQDLRPVVDALAERNGGSSLGVGQILVIPAGLS